MTGVGPTLDTNEAVKTAPLMVRVGGWTTHYQVSPHNGNSANITTPATGAGGD